MPEFRVANNLILCRFDVASSFILIFRRLKKFLVLLQVINLRLTRGAFIIG